jgi:hypothetical protein
VQPSGLTAGLLGVLHTSQHSVLHGSLHGIQHGVQNASLHAVLLTGLHASLHENQDNPLMPNDIRLVGKSQRISHRRAGVRGTASHPQSTLAEEQAKSPPKQPNISICQRV